MRDRSASTNASPVGPRPGASAVPRANTTSTSGQGCADAHGAAARGEKPAVPATSNAILRPLTCAMLTQMCSADVSKNNQLMNVLIIGQQWLSEIDGKARRGFL